MATHATSTASETQPYVYLTPSWSPMPFHFTPTTDRAVVRGPGEEDGVEVPAHRGGLLRGLPRARREFAWEGGMYVGRVEVVIVW